MMKINQGANNSHEDVVSEPSTSTTFGSVVGYGLMGDIGTTQLRDPFVSDDLQF